MTKSHLSCCSGVLVEHLSEEEVEDQAAVLKALADPTRLRIMDVLAHHPGEVCVCDLAEIFPQNQPTISHHLGILRQAGLVHAERRGTWTYYRPRRGRLVRAAGQLSRLAEAEGREAGQLAERQPA